MNGMYEELIDKLRKNNRMSGWTHIDRLMDDAIKAIEALQQENEHLKETLQKFGDKAISKGFLFEEVNFDNIRALQIENEQLRKQVARMREALEQEKKYCNEREGPCEFCKIACKTREALELIRQYAKDGCYCFVEDVADEALSTDTVQDYHNPSDVEALKKARKALCKGISELKVHCKYFDNTPEEDACIEMHEAVLEIDNAIGGKEDA